MAPLCGRAFLWGDCEGASGADGHCEDVALERQAAVEGGVPEAGDVGDVGSVQIQTDVSAQNQPVFLSKMKLVVAPKLKSP